MGSVLFWLLVVVCVVALVLLFFPFRFYAEFDLGERGVLVRLSIFRKLLWTYEKAWKEKSKKEDEPEEDLGDATPSFVDTASVRDTAPAPARESMASPAVPETPETPAAIETPAALEKIETHETPAALEKPETPAATSEKSEKGETPEKPAALEMPAALETPEKSALPENSEKPENSETPEKPEKRSLTDAEFWTIILTPDMDARAFRYVKRLLASLVRVFRIKFEDCYAEGIRADYKTMGFGAALNGILKGFPYLSAWDIRMDWCMEHELHAAGKVRASVNLCRVLAFALELVLYAGILLFLFWRRRAKILKTGELPELGYVRKKILAFIVEE